MNENEINEIWKPVPTEFTYGEEVLASNYGNIIYRDDLVIGHRGARGKDGHYVSIEIKGHTVYFHRLVFYAHTDLPVSTLKQGRVIFKNKTGIIDSDGYYRNWYEDLLFEQGKHDFLSLLDIITRQEDTHPLYGTFTYGVWIPVYIPLDKKANDSVELDNYELVLLNNKQYPMLVRNKTTNKIVKYHFSAMHDGYINLTHSKNNKNYQITHVMLLSVFPHITRNQTVDHIDDDPLNQDIKNLQWLSHSENCKKGAKITPRNPLQASFTTSAEIWKPLPITEYTAKMYMVSNRGRIKNTITVNDGTRLRGKKYRYTRVAVAKGEYVKHYMHHLVYLTFHGEITDGSIVLHDDTAPLNDDGTYRNWADDLRLGSKKENNIEYHSEKRTRVHTPESPTNTIITPDTNEPAPTSFVAPSVNWRTESIYSAYASGNIEQYKQWCETTVQSGPKWDKLWESFIKSMESDTAEEARKTIITKFIRKLSKDRECEQRKKRATPALKKWTIDSILITWKETPTLDDFKAFQENYTGDSPECPKWQARWNKFTTSLANANSDTERKTLIKNFTYAQRAYVYRQRHRDDDSEKPVSASPPEPEPEPPIASHLEPLSNQIIISQTAHPKQWKVKQIYEHFQTNTLDEYKSWCESTNNLSGPEWDIQWYTFILQLQATKSMITAEPIIREFIENLRKQRHDLLIQKRNHDANPLERDTRQQWPSVSVLRAWKEDKLDLFKAFQENYTGDSPECPKWQKRWNGFVTSLSSAESDEARKSLISKFMTAQRTRVFRAKGGK
jgi:hypothetical protein